MTIYVELDRQTVEYLIKILADKAQSMEGLYTFVSEKLKNAEENLKKVESNLDAMLEERDK